MEARISDQFKGLACLIGARVVQKGLNRWSLAPERRAAKIAQRAKLREDIIKTGQVAKGVVVAEVKAQIARVVDPFVEAIMDPFDV